MIPIRYQDASYDDVPESIKVLLREMKQNNKGLYIHGTVGTGKTHIAYAIKKQYEKVMGRTATFWSTTELFAEMKADFDRHRLDKQHTLDNLMESTRLLILDDIGAEKPTEWVQEQFYLLINKRYNEMHPTIFTSNLSISELSAQLGDRIASRIVEMCNIVRLDGTDRRLQKKGTS